MRNFSERIEYGIADRSNEEKPVTSYGELLEIVEKEQHLIEMVKVSVEFWITLRSML